MKPLIFPVWWYGDICTESQGISRHGIDLAGLAFSVVCMGRVQGTYVVCFVPIILQGLILGLHSANERRRYFVTTSYWLDASLESALYLTSPPKSPKFLLRYVLGSRCSWAVCELPEPRVIKQWGFLSYNPIKSQSHKIGGLNYHFVVKSDSCQM